MSAAILEPKLATAEAGEKNEDKDGMARETAPKDYAKSLRGRDNSPSVVVSTPLVTV